MVGSSSRRDRRRGGFAAVAGGLLCAALRGSCPALAAVPPLSDAQRAEHATVIAVGVLGETHVDTVEQREGFVNAVASASFAATSVEKGAPIDTVTWWTAVERPAGWAGHQGQHPVPPAGALVRVFATDDGELLVPNGWEPVEEASKPAAQEDAAREVAADDSRAVDDDAPEAAGEPEAVVVPSEEEEEQAAAETPEEEEELPEAIEEEEAVGADEGAPDDPPAAESTEVVERRALSLLKPWRALVQRIRTWVAGLLARLRRTPAK
mmetsp:Transcript_5799/g.24221  ORF Transcript_5799/g.24221 Transcript_5799/m.24221 type:complete len:266 (+) Transcript_5799:1001-1798(+)